MRLRTKFTLALGVMVGCLVLLGGTATVSLHRALRAAESVQQQAHFLDTVERLQIAIGHAARPATDWGPYRQPQPPGGI